MAFYAIYHGKKFVGYTHDKEMKNTFLKNRIGKYSIKKYNEKNIPKEIIESSALNDYCLVYYQGYRLSTELILFEYEVEALEEAMMHDVVNLSTSMYIILDTLPYLRMDKDTKRFIKIVFNKLINMLIDIPISGDHEIVYDEYINVVKYFNERFPVRKKPTDDEH